MVLYVAMQCIFIHGVCLFDASLAPATLLLPSSVMRTAQRVRHFCRIIVVLESLVENALDDNNEWNSEIHTGNYVSVITHVCGRMREGVRERETG